MTDHAPPPEQNRPPTPQHGPPPGHRPQPGYGPPPGGQQWQQQYAPPPAPPKRRRWPLILGGFVLAFIVMIGGCVAVIGGGAAVVASGVAGAGGPATIRYELEGDGTAMAVTWSTPSGVSQESSTTLPWSQEVAWDDTFAAAYTVSGGRDGMGDAGPITCRIVDAASGDVLAENTSNGEFANVSCDYAPALPGN